MGQMAPPGGRGLARMEALLEGQTCLFQTQSRAAFESNPCDVERGCHCSGLSLGNDAICAATVERYGAECQLGSAGLVDAVSIRRPSSVCTSSRNTSGWLSTGDTCKGRSVLLVESSFGRAADLLPTCEQPRIGSKKMRQSELESYTPAVPERVSAGIAADATDKWMAPRSSSLKRSVMLP